MTLTEWIEFQTDQITIEKASMINVYNKHLKTSDSQICIPIDYEDPEKYFKDNRIITIWEFNHDPMVAHLSVVYETGTGKNYVWKSFYPTNQITYIEEDHQPDYYKNK